MCILLLEPPAEHLLGGLEEIGSTLRWHPEGRWLMTNPAWPHINHANYGSRVYVESGRISARRVFTLGFQVYKNDQCRDVMKKPPVVNHQRNKIPIQNPVENRWLLTRTTCHLH